MPRWLKATLLAVGALAVASFLAQPAVAAGQRRQVPSGRERRHAGLTASAAPRSRLARFVQADHERLIITYSISDDTVYVLTPPGEDPRAVLRAARLVLPEDNYEDLADHLGARPAGSGNDAAVPPAATLGGGCRGAGESPQPPGPPRAATPARRGRPGEEAADLFRDHGRVLKRRVVTHPVHEAEPAPAEERVDPVGPLPGK